MKVLLLMHGLRWNSGAGYTVRSSWVETLELSGETSVENQINAHISAARAPESGDIAILHQIIIP